VAGVVALILTAVALPPLLARLTGGHPPTRVTQLAALAPAATVPATAAVIIAATAAPWLAVLLAIPAVILWAWQLPPLRGIGFQPAAGPVRESGSAPAVIRLRLFTVNAQGGAADPAAILRILRSHDVDVLAVQELTPQMVSRLEAAGLAQLLPFSHLDPRPGSPGTGLWARWPLTPLPPVPGLTAAAPRARIDPLGGRAVTLTAVHPLAPTKGHAGIWQRELTIIRQALAAADGPQVVAGDFNASRDHGPFRDLLTAGFRDCADSGQSRSWPGFTWPGAGRALPVMRLDHVLVSRTATVRMTRTIRMPHTDHHGVLAAIEFRHQPLPSQSVGRVRKGGRAGTRSWPVAQRGAYVTRFSRWHTAGAPRAGRPGSSPPWSRFVRRPGQAPCPGRCRGTAACPGRESPGL
jgi:endonuclease/exonuclease/phosphatase family metal-dependent hydrolase